MKKYSTTKLLIISLISGIVVIYPNISLFLMERSFLGESKHTAHLLFFIFRYLYFSALIFVLLIYNFRKIKTPEVKKRFINSFLITLTFYFLYIGFSLTLNPKNEWFSGVLLFQFFVTYVLSTLIGYLSFLHSEQRRKEQEIEQLKIESLQSRYDALTNQINPHLFFNSLNGLSSLIRKKNEEVTLEYVNKLSDVFRYILKSDKKVLVTLEEELEFVQAFRYMLEVRFANKLIFNIEVDKSKMDFKIPVLSLLPLIDNIVVHNTIDSEHKMEVKIWLNDKDELVISNPIYPKLSPPETNGTGLKNLEHRFLLLLNKQIRVENDGKVFNVYLPLKKDDDENTDC
ncbi:MAG TPA: histidine kinase [Bacteroidales bacterium]|nr:histidine kinase [Bacteroidales bacterium]HQG36083.1 histidine kinase [Bacteroidales bacterium]HQG52049.1 histidine kinase [Bacteroidales bacterium]HQJ21335.1 histidine kinase [Bacteroidales bacterium]